MRPLDRLSLARAAALIVVAELGVHQLRYLLAYGGASGEELAHQGHSYLGAAAPVLAVLAVSAIAAGLLRAALGGDRARGDLPLGGRTALFSLAILAVFCVQELAEGLVTAGHPAGIAALVAGGGLLALPLSILFGALAVLLDRGVSGLERRIATHRRSMRRRLRDARCGFAPGEALIRVRTASPLAFGLARRPPPVLS